MNEPARLEGLLPQWRARTAALLRERAAAPVGKLVLAEAEVAVEDPGAGRPRELEVGDTLFCGVRVRVGTGRALVRLEDGSDLWLGACSCAGFSGYGAACRRIDLIGGRALAMVARDPARPFEVHLPDSCCARAVGTVFEADAGTRSVAVLAGRVLVAAPEGTKEAAAGRSITPRGGRLHSSRMSRAAALAAGAWGDLSASAGNPAVAVEARLLTGTAFPKVLILVGGLCAAVLGATLYMNATGQTRASLVKRAASGDATALAPLPARDTALGTIIVGNLLNASELPEEVLAANSGRRIFFQTHRFEQAVEDLAGISLSDAQKALIRADFVSCMEEMGFAARKGQRVNPVAQEFCVGWNQRLEAAYQVGALPIRMRVDIFAYVHAAFNVGYREVRIDVWTPPGAKDVPDG